MRIMTGATAALAILGGTARAGELDLALGLQAAKTEWAGDHVAGGVLDASWWFRDWIGASFISKGEYGRVDDRLLSYFGLGAGVRHTFGPVRVTGTAGVVHQHEEPRAAEMEQPVASLLGVADGTRHRGGVRAGASIAYPFHRDRLYVALDLDATGFMYGAAGPSYMLSAGLSMGFTWRRD